MLPRIDILVSDLTNEIDELRTLLEEAENDATQWRRKYDQLLSESIDHSHKMIANVVGAYLVKVAT